MPTQRFAEAIAEYQNQVGGHEAWLARRYRAQTDLWFLSKEIFKRDLYENTHRPVINFFLKKTPFAPAWDPKSKYGLEEFQTAIAALAPLPQRKGLLLYPRGSFKSSIDADDVTQYIICYPDIRILILVGESSLGEAFVPEIKDRFILEKDREPTEFQLLFPEFVIETETDENRGGRQEYWSPFRRLKQKEPTLGSLSILGATSGWHCDVLKSDDCVTDTTGVENEKQRQKILRKFVTTMNLLDPHGILELLGTRYHALDLYAHFRKVLTGARYLCGASWTVLPHASKKKLQELTANDVILLFPERQGFQHLREKLLADEETFCLQQLNDPQMTGPLVTFNIEDLRKATTRVPLENSHKRYNFWDIATTDSKSSDYSVGVFITVDEKYRAYVQAMIVDKFSPAELTYQMAKFAKETNPEIVLCEQWNATEMWLVPEVRKAGVQMGYTVPIRPFKVDKTKAAKGNRIAGLEPLIKSGRLFFSNLIPNLDLLYKQFTEFTGEPSKHRHDDIPDAISFLRIVLPIMGTQLDPTPRAPRELGNGPENAAWQAAQTKDIALRNFLNNTLFTGTRQPVQIGQKRDEDPLFPGQ